MDDESIKVLIVDDSKSSILTIRRALASFTIIGEARNGREAMRLQARLKPDVITMDIHLPDIDGLELTRQILSRRPIPIIIISSMVSPERQGLIFEALRVGAYEVVAKTNLLLPDGKSREAQKLERLVRVAARTQPVISSETIERTNQINQEKQGLDTTTQPCGIVAIGASTGGPAVLRTIFDIVGSTFSIPILVAQHIPEGFIEGFVRWLATQTELNVQIGTQGHRPKPGSVYFAPSKHHLTLTKDGTINLEPCCDDLYCPSVDRLMTSVAKVYGSRAICILLTGMGSDGAQGMLFARKRKAFTAVQNRESSAIFGMPGSALKIRAAQHTLSVEQITSWLLHLSRRNA